MDLYSILLGFIIGHISTIFSIIGNVRYLFCHDILIRDINDVVLIDKMLLSRGIVLSKIGSGLPGYGMHIMFIGSSIVILYKSLNSSQSPFVLQARSPDFYKVYGTKRSIELIMKCLKTKNITIMTRPKSDSYSVLKYRTKPPLTPSKEQQKSVKKIMKQYISNGNASILISGEIGTGKSTVAKFVSTELETKYFKSTLIFRASSLADLITINETETDNRVIVFLFDEIDILFDKLQKQEICTMLDILNEAHNTITIATTNVPIDDLNKRFHSYLRPGRINHKMTFKEVQYAEP